MLNLQVKFYLIKCSKTLTGHKKKWGQFKSSSELFGNLLLNTISLIFPFSLWQINVLASFWLYHFSKSFKPKTPKSLLLHLVFIFKYSSNSNNTLFETSYISFFFSHLFMFFISSFLFLPSLHRLLPMLYILFRLAFVYCYQISLIITQ